MGEFDWGTAAAATTVLAFILGGFWFVWRTWVRPFLHRIGLFLEDWFGDDPRPGYDGRPSVPVRLAAIESEQRRVRHEVETNSGSSLKDAVKRTEERVQQIEERRQADREVLDTLAHLVGSFIGREQESRIEGHKAQVELFRTMQEINGDDEERT